MSGLNFESRRLDTATIINRCIKRVFGEQDHLSKEYDNMCKLSRLLCSELEKETLVWESAIRSDYIKSKRWKRKLSDGTARTDTLGQIR